MKYTTTLCTVKCAMISYHERMAHQVVREYTGDMQLSKAEVEGSQVSHACYKELSIAINAL